MRLKILKVLLLISSLGLLGFTVHEKYPKYLEQYRYDNVYTIYRSLVVHTGQFGMPPLHIITDPEVNAYTDGKGVYITIALLDTLSWNKNQVAMVLAHELAHNVLDHMGTHGWPDDQRIAEAQADKMGAFIMLRAGYDICEGKEAFTVFNDTYGDDVGGDHPSNAYRLDQLNFPWCYNWS